MQIVKMFAALLVAACAAQTLTTKAKAEAPAAQASFVSGDAAALIGCRSRSSGYHYRPRETYAFRQKFLRTFKRGHGVGSR